MRRPRLGRRRLTRAREREGEAPAVSPAPLVRHEGEAAPAAASPAAPFRHRLVAPCLLLILLKIAFTEASFDLEKALSSTCPRHCFNGVCVNESCVCVAGWKGEQCDQCTGRIQISENQSSLIDSPVNYASESRCAWLISNENTNSMTLRVNNFSTECGWDYLYIYGGDGVYGEQLATLCGLAKEPFEISVPAKSAFVYFFSDLAKNGDGFNISIEHDRCAYNCNDHGHCRDGACVCDRGYLGRHCERQVCTKEEDGKHGPCHRNSFCKDLACDCTAQSHGDFCQASKADSLWEVFGPLLSTPLDGAEGAQPRTVAGRASHATLIVGDTIWSIGGDHFKGVLFNDIETFNTTSRIWKTVEVEVSELPPNRYDHTAVLYKNHIYMFGGVIDRNRTTSELWSFDIANRRWRLESPENENYSIAPQAVAGHTAHVIKSKMYVFFGYNPVMGFLYHVQIYDFESRAWSYSDTSDNVNGRYGHSSIFVSSEETVLVYGGMTVPSQNPGTTNNVTDSLIQFNVKENTWTNLKPSGKNIFMHTATYLQGLMIVVGGSASEAASTPSDCFFGETLVYDIACKLWISTSDSPCAIKSIKDLRRFGHSTVADDKNHRLFVFGGYNGSMLNDVLIFRPAVCSSATRPESCRSTCSGIKCIFSASSCIAYNPLTSSYPAESFLAVVKSPPVAKNAPICQDDMTRQAFAVCEELKDCLSCASQSGCGWCVTGSQCLPSDAECIDGQEMIRAYSKCAAEGDITTQVRQRPCSMSLDCYSCKLLSHCNWFGIDGRLSCISLSEQSFITSEATIREAERLTSATGPVRISNLPTGLPIGQNVSNCPKPCAFINSCKTCALSGCMWCASAGRCVNTDSYLISFPYGQCHSWVTMSGVQKQLCDNEASTCIEHKTCKDCQVDPACGWLDDGEGTGMGRCLEGSSTRPQEIVSGYTPELWHFIGCPSCQCNGHSGCVQSPRAVALPRSLLSCEKCENHTAGAHCERCAEGFFGDARNGGVCKPCECNGQADRCDPSTGICFCRTKGVIGDYCDRCDQKYYGEPRKGEPCRYELAVDFIFTFKLKNDQPDKFVTEIYLFSVPYKRDTDVTFQISCEGSSGARVWLNLTSMYFDGRPGNPRMKMVNTSCDSKGLRRYYLANDPGYAFGTDANTTFYVKVSNFTTPITIQISFAQTPPINWVLFFVIFAACFIVLLVVAGLLWMIKLRVEAYRARQAHQNEIIHMASRPFSSVRLDLSNPHSNMVATPISIEPCSNYRAGVFTLAVRLPTGGKPNTPYSTSGMAVASALCVLTPAQLSVLQAPDNSDSRLNKKTNIRRYIPFFRQPPENS